MNDAVGPGHSIAQAAEVFDVATQHLGPRFSQCFLTGPDRDSPSTWCPAWINSGTSAAPMKPVARGHKYTDNNFSSGQLRADLPASWKLAKLAVCSVIEVICLVEISKQARLCRPPAQSLLRQLA